MPLTAAFSRSACAIVFPPPRNYKCRTVWCNMLRSRGTSPMDFDLVLRNVRLPDAKADQPTTDIGVKDGRIVAIAPRLGNAKEEVEGHGRLVCSGFVETHIHLDKSCILGRCEHTTKRSPHLAIERVSAVKHTM